MLDDYIGSMDDDFKGVIEHFKKELTSVRTGRASPQLLDSVRVDVASYGAVMPLNQLATVSAPEARLLVVNPWDKSTIHDIEKGIVMANLGLNPANDGQIIRVPIPALTGERRKQLVRKVGQLAEDARIRARSVRKDLNDLVKEAEAEKDITEDDLKRGLELVQNATNGCVAKLNDMAKDKEAEVLEVG